MHLQKTPGNWFRNRWSVSCGLAAAGATPALCGCGLQHRMSDITGSGGGGMHNMLYREWQKPACDIREYPHWRYYVRCTRVEYQVRCCTQRGPVPSASHSTLKVPSGVEPVAFQPPPKVVWKVKGIR